ncbi:MAG: XisI protein [Desulfobacteraceae bacterium]|nr:XisI protein [Desulfobacteraceae bacterium]
MDRVSRYRECIHQILRRYATHKPSYGDIEVQIIEDTSHDHYQVYHVGWHHDRRIHGCTLHIDIKDGKIWIQHNSTEGSIAAELVELGIPKEHIVLGFHVSYRRQFTEYAVQ